MKIALGSDHAGFHYKETIKNHLNSIGHKVTDFGTDSTESVDYPDFAHPVGKGVDTGEFNFGIVICGSGEGVSMTVNKYKNVRGALVWNSDVAKLCREHNDANILCLPARFISEHQAIQFVDLFLSTTFEGGRHDRRLQKISC